MVAACRSGGTFHMKKEVTAQLNYGKISIDFRHVGTSEWQEWAVLAFIWLKNFSVQILENTLREEEDIFLIPFPLDADQEVAAKDHNVTVKAQGLSSSPFFSSAEEGGGSITRTACSLTPSCWGLFAFQGLIIILDVHPEGRETLALKMGPYF